MTMPEPTTAPVTAEDGDEFTISREQVSPDVAQMMANATSGGGATEHVVQFKDEAVTAEGPRERLTDVATTWALMYPLANWPWPGRTLAGADAEHLDAIARDIAAAWGADIADRVLGVRDEELERLRAELANRDTLLEKYRETAGVIMGQREEAKAERDALKSVWSEWRSRLGGSFPRAMVQEMDAALAVPESHENPIDALAKASPAVWAAKHKHIGGGANAEDCPACSGTNPPYPFICPGEPEASGEGSDDA
jgi:hypothetical protein